MGTLADLRHALRTLLRSPGFALAAILTFAAGVSANTAIFSFVSRVLLQPLPFADANRLVAVFPASVKDLNNVGYASPEEFAVWNRGAQDVASLALYQRPSKVALTLGGDPEQLEKIEASPEFLNVIGVRPVAGRAIEQSDTVAGAPDVAMISASLWQRRFARDAAIVGRQIRLDDRLFTVIGVMPSLSPFENPDLLTPLVPSAYAAEHNATLFLIIGRLRDGVSAAAAESALAPTMTILRRADPRRWARWTLRVEGLQDHIVGETRPFLLMLMGSVGFVLLITCANLAGLVFARSAAGRHNVAIRISLGATNWHIVRHELAEMAIIATTGCGLAILFAWWILDALKALAPVDLPVSGEIRLDGRVLLFTLGLGIFAALLGGLAPAIKAASAGAQRGLGEARFGGPPVRHLLVGCQLALCVILVAGAALMIRTMTHLRALPLGFQVDNVISFKTTLPKSRYPDVSATQRFAEGVHRELMNSATVESAGAINLLPLAGRGGTARFELTGAPPPNDGAFARNGWREAQYRVVQGEYFQTLGIPLIAGRLHQRHDSNISPCAVVVNQTFVQAFLTGQNPIGHTIREFHGKTMAPAGCEIVGVVGDVRHWGHTMPIWPEIYYSLSQMPAEMGGWAGQLTFVTRSRSTTANAINGLRAAVLRVDKDQPIHDVRTLAELRSKTTSRQRFVAVVLTAFGVWSLLLSGLGVYALLAGAVNRRAREIGIRMALGATRANVLRLVTSQLGQVAVIALAAGTAGALLLARVLSALLFGVKPNEPGVYLAVAVTLFAVTILAAILPTRRACSLDPATTLHQNG